MKYKVEAQYTAYSQWDIAVGMMESKELSDEGMIDMHYVQDMVDDAIEEAEQRSR